MESIESVAASDETVAAEPVYAGFWVRFGAYCLDYMLCSVIGLVLGLVLGFAVIFAPFRT